MARDRRPIVKLSRREGYALHLKAHKAMVKRTGPPGQQSGRYQRSKTSQYALQLREKQKVKRLYGLLERQFAGLMAQASRSRGQSGEVLLALLESRADNAVYRAGFASSRRAARQLVTHGHFLLNGRRLDIPSIKLKSGDQLQVRPVSLRSTYFKQLDDISPAPETLPPWLKVSRPKRQISVSGPPDRSVAEPGINVQLIVEYYSR